MERAPNRDDVIALFERIKESAPHLSMKLTRQPEHVDLDMEIPQQAGLDFAVDVNLQGDELHLNAGAFWLEWFPCYEEFISATFLNAVTGLISGRLRIVEFYRGNKAVRAELQEPTDHGWRTIGTWSTAHIPFPLRKTKRILQNAQQPPARDPLSGPQEA